MRYPSGHKSDTRRRIVAAAARAFRGGGIAEVSIPRVMADAGLTHGGFYAHFASKDALVAEVCAATMAEAEARLHRWAGRADGGATLGAVLDGYLSEAHRDDPARGCAMPALGSELPRQAPGVRAAFTATLRGYLRALDALIGEPDADAAPGGAGPSDRALATLSAMAGAILLARAVDDSALGERILHATRDFLRDPCGTAAAADDDC